MGNYLTIDDLVAAAGGQERLDQLTTAKVPPSSWTGTVSDYWAGQAIERGEGYIDSILAPRYQTPLTSIGVWLKHEGADHGIYFLASSTGMATDEEIQKAQARDLRLADARDGKRFPADPLPSPTRAGKSTFVEFQDAWSRRDMKGFV